MSKQYSIWLQENVDTATKLFQIVFNNTYPELKPTPYTLTRSDIANQAVKYYIRQCIQKLVEKGKKDGLITQILELTKNDENNILKGLT